jgi:hypothetical protein
MRYRNEQGLYKEVNEDYIEEYKSNLMEVKVID